jgi:hypothetical protein
MTRKIETLMNRAIAQGKNWSLANTTVTHNDDVAEVRLHGNLIAEIGDDFITLYDGGWRTVTTKSRISAILKEHGSDDGIYQKNYEWFLYNHKTQKSEPFYNGVTLR